MPDPLRKYGSQGLLVVMLPLDAIQVRPGFNHRDTMEVSDLELVIEAHGTESLHPLRVAFNPDGSIWLVSGHRRLQAAKNVRARGIPILTIPCQRDKEKDEATLFAHSLAENIQRADLTPTEQSRAFQRLISYGWTPEAIATAVGKSVGHVHTRLTWSETDTAVKAAVNAKQITPTDAVKVVRTAAREGKAQQEVLDHMTATKTDRRTKKARALPLDMQCGRALQPLVEKFTLKRCRAILDHWPIDLD